MSKLTLPGLIDVHAHLRDPGQTQKEDFYTGTSAALAGGYIAIFDMPNNSQPITTKERLEAKIKIAKEKIVCDMGFYFGSLGDNLDEFEKVQGKIFGLKLYLNFTTGNYILTPEKVEKIYKAWPGTHPILVHAEEEHIDFIADMVRKTGKKTHVCHVSSQSELERIIKAKEEGLPISCGVTPHHLFLTEEDVKTLGPFGRMKPVLKTKKDQKFLWRNIRYIDVIETDHAPHTKEEKEKDAPYGVPGLETMLPLLLTAQHDGRLTLEQIIDLCFYNPKRIFAVPTSSDTKIEVEIGKYEIQNENLLTKCSWSPFDGFVVRGRVVKVVLRGQKVFENGKVLSEPGAGIVLQV